MALNSNLIMKAQQYQKQNIQYLIFSEIQCFGVFVAEKLLDQIQLSKF